MREERGAVDANNTHAFNICVQRPLTHDLLRSVLDSLDADIKSVRIVGVHGTTFFSQIELISKEGEHIYVDARPSDAIALAVRTNAPIFADESVLPNTGDASYVAGIVAAAGTTLVALWPARLPWHLYVTSILSSSSFIENHFI